MKSKVIAFCMLLAFTTPAGAATFGVVFDGSVASVDPFTDPIQDFNAGPAFTLSVRASGADFWRIVSPIPSGSGGLLGLYTTGSSSTGGSLEFFRSGALVASATTSGGLLPNHIGAGLFDNVSALVGLAFDVLRLSHPGGGSGALQLGPDVLHPSPFYRWASFEYNAAGGLDVAQTPLPPALLLFGSALIGLGWLGRRRQKASAIAA